MTVTLGLLWLVSGCDPLPPESLDDVDFAAGTVLDVNEDVALRVIGGRAGAFVTVRTTTDGIRFEGPLSTIAPRGLHLRVAPSVEALDVEIRDATGAAAFTVPIQRGTATLDLGGAR